MRSLVSAISIALLVAASALAADIGAKGMFYQQLERPTEKLNNGVQYWIELKRGGQLTRVNNKYEFRTGDQIRLHVRSNMDGYAYVVLREGSRGEHATLFPDPRHADDNRIKANVEYTIPGDSYLIFDQYPGTERVNVVLSRNPVQPSKPNFDRDKVVVAASRIEGSKDLVPGSFVVSYDNAPAAAPYVPSQNTQLATPTTTPPSVPASNPTPPTSSPDDASAIITVVQKNAADALALEICLEHKP